MRAFKLKVHFSRAGNFSGNNFHKIEIISRAWKFGLEFQKGCSFITGFQQLVNRRLDSCSYKVAELQNKLQKVLWKQLTVGTAPYTSCTQPNIDHFVVDVGLVAISIMYFSWRFECHQDQLSTPQGHYPFSKIIT